MVLMILIKSIYIMSHSLLIKCIVVFTQLKLLLLLYLLANLINVLALHQTFHLRSLCQMYKKYG